MKCLALLIALSGLAYSLPVDPPMNMPMDMSSPSHHHSAPVVKQPVGIKLENLASQFSPTYKRVRVTYGQFHLPAFNESKPAMPMTGMPGMNMGSGMDMSGGMNMDSEGGMLDASNHNAPAPCTDCTLKYARTSLVYPDGTIANINTGAWLHHLTLSLRGPTRSDLRCPGGTKRIPLGMERILAFHNDRNETFFGLNALDERGLYVGKDDVYDMELMLKNELNVPKDVQYVIDWEFVPGKPANWGNVRGIWMDAAPCSAVMSDIDPPKDKLKFKLEGDDWTSSVNGILLNTVGHMHDGGVQVQILQNGNAVCKSNAVYDAKPEYIPSPKALDLGAAKMSHISSYTPCNGIGEIKKGDKLSLTASYDFDTHKPGLNKVGAESDVMGVAMLFVDVKS